MTDEPAPPRSELPPQLGELIAEIDSASHDAARTMAVLVGRLDVPSRVRRAARRRVQVALGAAGTSSTARRVGSTVSVPVTRGWPILVVAAVLLVLARQLRKFRASGGRSGGVRNRSGR
jgi:hypothetical protein